MQQISTLFGKLETKKERTSNRNELVAQFVDEINFERIGTKHKPITGRAVAFKLTHISVPDLYYFLSVCKDYKNRHGSFGKCFFGSLKVK